MKIHKLDGLFGAVVTELDQSKELMITEKEQLRAALLEFGLLVVKGEILSPEDQIRFSKTFGDLETFPWAYTQLHNYPEIFRLSNDPDYGYENVGMYWHSDGSFRQLPTAISLFHPIVLPDAGGQTWFSYLSAAIEDFDDPQLEELRSLNTVHRNGIVHPLIKQHPVTGTEHLYLNMGLTSGVVGKTQEESQRLFDDLNNRLSVEEHVYKHEWQPGDLVVADNFAVAHQARPVTDRTRRILHRTTVSNDGVFWNKERESRNREAA